MQVNEARLRELSQKRLILEKKSELRRATLIEFEAAHADRNIKFIKSLEAENKKAQDRNNSILREISCSTVSGYANLRDYSETKSKNAHLLNEERKRYVKSLEGIQPVWKAESVLKSESNLAKLKADREYITQRRQAWQAEAAKEEVIKSALEMERRELMIQLALEQKDKISSDARVHGIMKQRESLETVLVDELTSYGEECREQVDSLKIEANSHKYQSEPSEALDLNSSVNQDHQPRHRPNTYSVGAGRGVSADYANNMIDTLRQRFQNHNTISTLPLPPPDANAATAVSGALTHASREYYQSMLNEQHQQWMRNSVAAPVYKEILDPSRQVLVAPGNVANVSNTANSNDVAGHNQHIYGTSFPSAPLQQPSPSISAMPNMNSNRTRENIEQGEYLNASSGEMETQLHHGRTPMAIRTQQLDNVYEHAVSVDVNGSSTTPVPPALPSLQLSTSPVTVSNTLVVESESRPHINTINTSSSTSTANTPLSKSPSSSSAWTLKDSSSIVHCTDTDLAGGGSGIGIGADGDTAADAVDVDVDSDSDLSVMPPKSPSMKSNSNNNSTKKPTWDDVVDVSTPAASNVFTRLSSSNATTPSSSTKVTSPSSSAKENKDKIEASSNIQNNKESVEQTGAPVSVPVPQQVSGNSNMPESITGTELNSNISESPASIIRFTDDWKTIQCAVALKQLYERFEDHPGNPEVTKRLYMASMKSLCVAHTTSNTNTDTNSEQYLKSISALNTTKSLFRLVMPAALQKRIKELAVYGNDLIILGCIDVILERVDQIIPLDLLNGIVTLDKLIKHYKRASGGGGDAAGVEELLNALLTHLKLLIESRIFSMDDIVKLYVDAMTSELLSIDGNYSDANRARISRKITTILKEGVLNGGTHHIQNHQSPYTNRNSNSQDSSSNHMISSIEKSKSTISTTTSVSNNHPSTTTNMSHKTPYSNKKNVSFSTTNFADFLDDDEIADDEPIAAPPKISDMTVFVEQPTDEDKQKYQSKSVSKSEPMDDEEFDFL